MAKDLEMKDIEKIKIFREIKSESKSNIRAIGIKKELKKGEILFQAKDNVRHIYAVLSGKVSMYRINSEGKKRVFFILGEGDLVNEVVFDNLPVSVECEAFERAQILQLEKSDFLSVMERDFDLTMKILNSIGRKQRRLYRQLKNTLPIGMEKKLAAKLWKLAKDYGVVVEDSWNNFIEGEEPWKKINMKISCTYIAYMLGTSRETISRAMKILQDFGACQWVNRQLWVKEEKLLKYYRS